MGWWTSQFTGCTQATLLSSIESEPHIQSPSHQWAKKLLCAWIQFTGYVTQRLFLCLIHGMIETDVKGLRQCNRGRRKQKSQDKYTFSLAIKKKIYRAKKGGNEDPIFNICFSGRVLQINCFLILRDECSLLPREHLVCFWGASDGLVSSKKNLVCELQACTVVQSELQWLRAISRFVLHS